MRKLFSTLFQICFCFNTLAQAPVPAFTIKKTTGTIQLDGVLDEVDWQRAEIVDELYQQFPNDTSKSVVRTEFRATHDDHFIYFSAVSYDNRKGGYVISSLRRDYRGPGLDGVTFIIDPFQDVTNGFFFGLSVGLDRWLFRRLEFLLLHWRWRWFKR